MCFNDLETKSSSYKEYFMHIYQKEHEEQLDTRNVRWALEV